MKLPLEESAVRKQWRHRPSPVRFLLFACSGLVIILVVDYWGILTGLKNLSGILHESFSNSTWQAIAEQTQPSPYEPIPEAEVNQTRYQNLLAELRQAADSWQLQQLKELGHAQLAEYLNLSVQRAGESYADGDIDNALRLLESAFLTWRESIESIPPTPVDAEDEPVFVEILIDGAAESESENQPEIANGLTSESVEFDRISIEPTSPLTATSSNLVSQQKMQDSILNGAASGTEGMPSIVPQNRTESTEKIHPSPHSQEMTISQYLDALTKIDYQLAWWSLHETLVPGHDRKYEKILSNRQKAVEAYGANDFFEAARLIAVALRETEIVLKQEEEYFELNMNMALDAYAAEDVERAGEAIGRAASLRPNDDMVAYWRQQINDLPKLLQAQRDADQANRVGQLSDELDALERILSYRPTDAAVTQRIATVQKQLRDQEFNEIINQGNWAVTAGDTKRAKMALADAKRQRPSNAQTVQLNAKIVALERQQTLAHHLTTALRNSQQDNWEGTLRSFEQALAIEATHSEAIRGRDLARQITQAQHRLDDFLARPHRLSSNNVAEAARAVVQEAQLRSRLSAKLKTSANALKLEIVKWQTPIPVRVRSDGLTDIGVRGIGRIGTTKERIIELRPGKYVFEGKRKGYRSVLIEAAVKIEGNKMMEITVVCDERS